MVPATFDAATGLLRFKADIAADPAHPAWLYEVVRTATAQDMLSHTETRSAEIESVALRIAK